MSCSAVFKIRLVSILPIISFLFGNSVSYGDEDRCSREISTIQKETENNLEKRIALLTAFSQTQFQTRDIKCGIQAIERAAAITRSLPVQAIRAASGYEIKDTVFHIIEHRYVEDIKTETRLISAALQSVDSNKRIIITSGVDERVNDSAFLVRIAKHLDTNGRRSESKDFYVLAIQLDQAVPLNAQRLSWLEVSQHIESRIKAQEFVEAAELLTPIREEERQRYYVRLIHPLRYNDAVSLYRDRHFKSLPPDVIRREIRGMEMLFPLLEKLKLQQGAMVENSWIIFPYLFIADGYRALGNEAKAANWFDKAISIARNDENSISRCRLLIRIAADFLNANANLELARTLVTEAEQIAATHPDPKWQRELSNNIDTVKRRLKNRSN